jgi:Uma2 family endonuclease
LLVVEVSYSSLRYDRGIMRRIYAEAGIPEYWIVNLVDRVVEVYSEPKGGKYASERTLRSGETLAPAAFPDFLVEVAALLP